MLCPICNEKSGREYIIVHRIHADTHQCENARMEITCCFKCLTEELKKGYWVLDVVSDNNNIEGWFK